MMRSPKGFHPAPTVEQFAKDKLAYMRANARFYGRTRPELLPVTVTVKHIIDTLPANMRCQDPDCCHKGKPMELRSGKGRPNPLRASPDCIERAIGYKRGNIRWTHWECNWNRK